MTQRVVSEARWVAPCPTCVTLQGVHPGLVHGMGEVPTSLLPPIHTFAGGAAVTGAPYWGSLAGCGHSAFLSGSSSALNLQHPEATLAVSFHN